MTDNQIFAICATVIIIAFFACIAFRIWLDYKEGMRDEI